MSATSVAAFLRRDLLLLRRNTASLISMFVVPPLSVSYTHLTLPTTPYV